MKYQVSYLSITNRDMPVEVIEAKDLEQAMKVYCYRNRLREPTRAWPRGDDKYIIFGYPVRKTDTIIIGTLKVVKVIDTD